jgi:hypothetical protein
VRRNILVLEWRDDAGRWFAVPSATATIRRDLPRLERQRNVDRLHQMAYRLAQEMACAVRMIWREDGLPDRIAIVRDAGGEVNNDVDDYWLELYADVFGPVYNPGRLR